MTSQNWICRQVRVTGRVQGVWFRESTRRQAEEVGVLGWVRNLPDGSVEARFQGEPDKVNAMVAWCRKGPPAAHVIQVTADNCPDGVPPGARFSIRR